MLISIARRFEAERDAEDFWGDGTPDKSKRWHDLKCVQFGLLIFSFNLYFIIVHFAIGLFNFWLWSELVALGIVLLDALIAHFVFKYFLAYYKINPPDND